MKPYDEPARLEGLIPSYEDSYYFAGIEGEIINPLWSIALDVGMQDREYDGSSADGSSNDGLTFSARLNYAADENRNYYAVIARDFGTSTRNAISYERTRITLGGDYRVTEMWSTFFGVTLAESEYDNDILDPLAAAREEHVMIGKIGVSYIPNEYLTVTGSYQYIDVNLDNSFTWDGSAIVPNPGYSNNVLMITAAVRY